VDWASDVPYENLVKLDNTPGLKVVNVPSFKTLFGALNTRKPPLKDVRVRQALLHTFPYEAYISKALGGYATRSRGLIAAGMPGFAADLEPYTFDLDKARACSKRPVMRTASNSI
jgi:peptide/nickel transport system substrate-binding protein